MPAPVTVSVDVPFPRDRVFDFLDVLANHEPFTDHALRDWRVSGPDRGVGARATVTSKAGGISDTVEIEVVEAEAPRTITERNVAQKAKRVGTGTYVLEELDGGAGTRVSFTFAWEQAPLADRLLAPLVRRVIRRINERAMQRLAEQLPAALQATRA